MDYVVTQTFWLTLPDEFSDQREAGNFFVHASKPWSRRFNHGEVINLPEEDIGEEEINALLKDGFIKKE